MSSNGNVFRVTDLLRGESIRGIHGLPVESPHKGQWRGALCFLWFAPEQTVGQTMQASARRHRAQYDVTLMFSDFSTVVNWTHWEGNSVVVNIIQLMALYKTGYTTLAKVVIYWITGLNVYMAWYMMHNVMSAMAASARLVWQLLVVWHSYGTRAFRTNANLLQCVVDGLNSLRPNDTYIRHQARPSLVQIITCHYLNQWYVIVNYTLIKKLVFKIQTYSLKKMHSKLSSGRCRPFCHGLNVLLTQPIWGVIQSSPRCFGWLTI